MNLGKALESVLALQSVYTSQNTEDMKRRGELVRNDIPLILSTQRASLAIAAQLEFADLLIEGKDGVGLKAEVPWVRFASREASPSATTGWYVVWLHSRDGSGVYLALAHGSTQFHGGALVARSDDELAALMAWSRAALSRELSKHSNLMTNVSLKTRAPLAVAYEKSCVAAFHYPFNSIPDDVVLEHDMLVMADLLGLLYEAERLGKTPLSTNPDLRDALEAVTAIARPGPARRGQGFGLNARERQAIEKHSMGIATAHLVSMGYVVKDVSATESFDLLATRGDESIKVEVKGTTGNAAEILLTFNEITVHKKAFPANALCVIHSVQLTTNEDIPTASGGTLRTWIPWQIDELYLKGITYTYQLERTP